MIGLLIPTSSEIILLFFCLILVCVPRPWVFLIRYVAFIFFLQIRRGLNPFETGNPFLGTKLPGFSIGRGLGALKGLSSQIEG